MSSSGPRLLSRLAVAVLAMVASWYLMMLVHEVGHALGAWVSGGGVRRVVVPLVGFSRTDVEPNPHPLLVVWAGPMVGSLLPLGIWSIFLGARRASSHAGKFAAFFAGFCLAANGAYLLGGAISPVGDVADMVRHGTARWVVGLVGVVLLGAGLWVWHDFRPGKSRARGVQEH